jgi:uncharacterized peroxidase-related enzyme
MAKFEFHTPQSAPQAARPALEAAQQSLGFVPNLYAMLAENPAALEAYQTLAGIFAKAGFSPIEQQLAPLIVSVENKCSFCVAAHSALAAMAKVRPDLINAVRDGAPIGEPKLEALRVFTVKVMRERGFVADADISRFLEAGFTKADVLGVVLVVAWKTISNYANHLAETPLNPAFAAFAWTPHNRAA